MVTRWLGRLVLSFQFLTRLPLPISVPCDDDDLAASMAFYPLVALAVGALSALAGYLSLRLLGDPLLAALAVMLTNALFTGSLHIDGLADAGDGLSLPRSKERTLEILRDSRLGTHGAVALFFDLALHTALLRALLVATPHAFALWMVACIAGRAAAVACAKLGPYARATAGMGRAYVDRLTMGHLVAAIALALALALALPPWNPIQAAPLALAIPVVLLWTLYLRRRIGGHTGDTMGACNEFVELLTLAFFLLAARVGWM